MLANGLLLIVDRAAEASERRLALRHLNALRLGVLREDVRRLPLLGVVYEHLSLTHFGGVGAPGGFFPYLWLGPGSAADAYYDEALARARAGKLAAAFVQLGRASHLLCDMACPCHVRRVIHETDPYEWHVETHAEALARLPLPGIPTARRPSDLIRGLAALTARHEADASHSLIGRVLRRKSLSREAVASQAEALIPAAAAHVASLLRLFESESG